MMWYGAIVIANTLRIALYSRQQEEVAAFIYTRNNAPNENQLFSHAHSLIEMRTLYLWGEYVLYGLT